MRRVAGSGSLAAPIVVVAEAPGEWEEKIGRPLVGPSGQRLDDWWGACGLGREMMRLENVVEERPPGNKLDALSKDTIAAWIADLHQRLARLKDPIVIVAVGNLALTALTGKKGITKWRGSVLTYTDLHGRTIKCIPTIHPAATFREPHNVKRCRKDWERVKRESEFREVVAPTYTHITRPTLDQVEEYVTKALAHGGPMSIDIETPHNRIGCVGFAYEPHTSITIPTMGFYKKYEQPQAWYWIRELCEGENEKILQNGFFDAYWLRQDAHMEVHNYKWDLLAMHHCLDAADDHDLAYMASVYLNQVYWKDEAKDPESIQKYASNFDALWVYNGIDNCVQRSLYDVFLRELIAADKLKFYRTHYMPLFNPLLDMMLHGVRVDAVKMKRHLTKLIVERLGVEEQLLVATEGIPLVVNNGISPKKLLDYMKSIGVKPPKTRSVAKMAMVETTNEAAIRRMVKKHPKFAPVGTLILRHRSVKKEGEFYASERVDQDGRFRSAYKITTTTGRLASSANPKGSGANAQNVDRDARWVFLPDDGCVFIEVDLSQAESRVVGIATGDPTLIELADAIPGTFDVHTFNASVIFSVPESEVTKEQRYLGKRGVHASNYGMAGDTLSDQLAKEGIFVPGPKCQAMIDRYHERFPAIRGWQRGVRATILQERKLVNSWGRVFDVSHMHLNDETYRMCYASGPQSEVIDWMNQYGLIPIHDAIKARAIRARLNLHVHDALVASVPATVDDVHRYLAYVHSTLEEGRSRRLGNGKVLHLFNEYKIGLNWGNGLEFKRLPSREAVAEALHALGVG